MIRLHREGRWIILFTILIVLLILILSALFLSLWINYLLNLGALVLLILVLRFFRKPSRRPFVDEKTIVAPADGKVLSSKEQCRKNFWVPIASRYLFS